MEDAFGTVLFIVVAVGAVVAVVTFAGAGKAYDQIGKGLMSLRDGNDRPLGEPTGSQSAAEREAEIRQLLEARNVVRARSGKAPLDIERQLAALTRPAADPALESEVRSLVVARNERGIRRGRAPIDIEAEVARQMADLG